jgi:hypothetical protein
LFLKKLEKNVNNLK